MKPKIPTPLTDADFAAALAADRDHLVPSSGFTDAVMAAVLHESAAPAPLPFPWKRALPGFAAVAAVVFLIVAVFVALLRAPHSAVQDNSLASGWSVQFQPFLHQASPLDTAGILVAFLVSAGVVLLCRRLLSLR